MGVRDTNSPFSYRRGYEVVFTGGNKRKHRIVLNSLQVLTLCPLFPNTMTNNSNDVQICRYNKSKCYVIVIKIIYSSEDCGCLFSSSSKTCSGST